MDRFDLLPLLLTLSAVAAFSTACARTPAPEAGKDEASASVMTLEELRGRTVAYADSVKAVSDVSSDAFSSAIGVKLLPIEPGSKVLRTERMQLATGHFLSADYVPIGEDTAVPVHSVGLLPSSGAFYTEDSSAECMWDAAEMGKELESVGFHRGANRPFQRGRIQRYWRNLDESDMVFDASLMTYKTQSKSGERTCVYVVRYSGGAK